MIPAALVPPPARAIGARDAAWLGAAVLAALLVVAFAALAANVGLRLVARGAAATYQDTALLARATLVPGVARAMPAALTRAADPAIGLASPAAGTTGTIALPPPPTALALVASGESGVVPARAFSLAGIAAIDRGRALECLATAVYYEAASESDAGQRAVAQVVLNRVRHPAFPATICGVVYQGSERAGCQFSFACDGAMARAPAASAWARASRNAALVLTGQVFAPVGLATHYHTYAVTPAWNRTLVMTDAIGAHFFHRWKGYWGTATAFAQRYRGGEPIPGPHARVAPVSPLVPVALPAADATVSSGAMTLAVNAATPPAGAVAHSAAPIADVQPAHAASGQPLVTAGSQVLDKWKDAGRPLR